MIKVTKAEKPDVLKQNETQWTKEFVDAKLQSDKSGAPIPGTIKFRYRHKDIKKAIVDEAHGKCGYCESKIRHTHPGDTEHIVPTSRKPELAFDWHNLVLSCKECNHGKLDHPQDEYPLVDPTRDNPINHFVFTGPIIFPRPGDQKAIMTRDIIGLNRTELVERRQEKLNEIELMIHQWANAAASSPHKRFLERKLTTKAESDQEYAYMVSCVIQYLCKLKTTHSPA